MLETISLRCERDERLLFNELSITINAGELLQIKGPNGSGKTTLLRILAGLFAGYEGQVLWQGEPLHAVHDDYVSNMLYLGHQLGVKTQLTPYENLHWYGQLHENVDKAELLKALEEVGLRGYEDVLCQQLSEGQKRRVALARLKLTQASLWILDEPFAAIDQAGVAQLEILLSEHVQKGGSVILTTHHLLNMQREMRVLSLGVEAAHV